MRAYHEDDEDDFEDEDVDERTSQIVGDMDINMEDVYGQYEESGDGEGEGDGEGDEEDEDEEEDDEDDGDEDEDDEEEDDTEEGEGDEEEEDGDDVEMANGDDGSSPSRPSSSSVLPPNMARRQLLRPSFPFSEPPSTLSIEAICAIPLPSPVHSMAMTPCSSFLLTGSQEGYVRAYDFWSSVNGKQLMTAQQRTAVGFGEGVSKAGVARGWWENEVMGSDGETKAEPVYSMQVESDGLWALTGTRSGQINLYTLRHSPGHFVTSLKGHSSVVSCMTLLPGEKSFISGGWDGTLREWDLNTGQTVRSYPTHGAQISSTSLRALNAAAAGVLSNGGHANGVHENGLSVSVRVGEDFFDAKEELPPSSPPASSTPRAGPEDADAIVIASHGVNDSSTVDAPPQNSSSGVANGDGSPGDDAPSPYDPLFDDDAEGEDVPPSDAVTLTGTPGINDMAPPPLSPSTTSNNKPGLSLALPGAAGLKATTSNPLPPSSTGSGTTPLFPQAQHPSSSSSSGPSRLDNAGAAAGIPLLSPADYRDFSDNILMYSSMDGQVTLIDRREPTAGEGSRRGGGVGRLIPGDKAPPWCMSACWSAHGNQVLAGRRNGAIDVWDVRKSSSTSFSSSSSSSLQSPNLLRTLRTPLQSGPVSCIVPFPDGKHVATASTDNIRLWNTVEYFDQEDDLRKKSGRPPFKIIAGHHGGTVSSMLVDPTCRFLVTASGDRGWQGESTKVVLVHEVKW